MQTRALTLLDSCKLVSIDDVGFKHCFSSKQLLDVFDTGIVAMMLVHFWENSFSDSCLLLNTPWTLYQYALIISLNYIMYRLN